MKNFKSIAFFFISPVWRLGRFGASSQSWSVETSCFLLGQFRMPNARIELDLSQCERKRASWHTHKVIAWLKKTSYLRYLNAIRPPRAAEKNETTVKRVMLEINTYILARCRIIRRTLCMHFIDFLSSFQLTNKQQNEVIRRLWRQSNKYSPSIIHDVFAFFSNTWTHPRGCIVRQLFHRHWRSMNKDRKMLFHRSRDLDDFQIDKT